MKCSTDLVMRHLQLMAKSKRGVLGRYRLTEDQAAEQCEIWAPELARRFEEQAIARGCRAIATEFKGWPDLPDLLDACAQAHNAHAHRVEDHRSNGDQSYLTDALKAAGVEPTVLHNVGYDRWAPLHDLYRRINVQTLRRIVNGIKGGKRLMVTGTEWRLSHDEDPELSEGEVLERAGYEPRAAA